ncbi:MAG: hypothetical protein GJ676_12575 [Rhodobacteraceae bacterium]|nr:hypothetical protein [Paracoccaceae bacterium]
MALALRIVRRHTCRAMTILRVYLAVFLALVVAVTGYGVGTMRGQADPSGQIVLCTSVGPVSVYVDEDGQPTQAPHHCPDCTMQLLASLEPPSGMEWTAPHTSNAFETQPSKLYLSYERIAPAARGPPRFV